MRIIYEYFISVTMTSFFCDAAKIMVIFPLPGKSHSILGDSLVKHLLQAGHEVTYLTYFPDKHPLPRLRVIDVSIPKSKAQEEFMNIKTILDSNGLKIDLISLLPMIINTTHSTVTNKDVQSLLLDTNEHFDAVIADWYFTEIFSGFSALFNCPMIWFSSNDPHWRIVSLVDELYNPAYFPDVRTAEIVPLTFTQRLQELWNQIKGLYVVYYLHNIDNEFYKKHFVPLIIKRGYPVPNFEKLVYNGSLVLGNSHVSLGHSIRLPQNYKPVGGFHIDVNVKALPQELKKIMDYSKDGVIYFSMGSNLQSKTIPDDLKQNILKMFGGLKQTILWKFEENLTNAPKNVHILQWAPQQSILAHPNCKLFISHGGLLSTTETVHFGVPIIGIPIFMDQFTNVARAVKKGFAKRITISYNIAEDMKNAIHEVLSNPRYEEKVKELSGIYHDRLVSPDKELVYWVEHVIRTKGARHLRSPALDVPWFQKMYLDLAVITVAITIVLIMLMKKLLTAIFGNKPKRDLKKTN